MSEMILETVIRAPAELCFDLYRSIDLHRDAYKHANERVVGGKTSGLAELGDEVNFVMRLLKMPYSISIVVDRSEPPIYFRDSQTAGTLKSAVHHHYFELVGQFTTVTDRFVYDVGFGPVGRLLDRLLIRRVVVSTMSKKNAYVKAVAETDQAWNYVDRRGYGKASHD